MREFVVASLILFFTLPVSAQGVPAGWQIVKDSKSVCQVAVPADWSPYGETRSAAVLHDSSTALAVVTSQPGQTFAPLPDAVLRVLDVPQEQIFENTATRIFYQDKKSTRPGDPNGYSFSVPGKSGVCSGRLTFLVSVTEEVARKIALSLGPVTQPPTGSN